MNLQIIGDKSIKKIIAVADDILEQDCNALTLTVLRQIIAHCGLDDRYQVVPAGELEHLSGKWMPYAWVAEDLTAQPVMAFPIRVSDYDCGAEEGMTYHHTTFSTETDGADFVARNVRRFQNAGYAFDLVGLGIIGRIHLISNDPQILRATLIAASAALSCGVSFADVVEVLNGISAMFFRSSCVAR